MATCGVLCELKAAWPNKPERCFPWFRPQSKAVRHLFLAVPFDSRIVFMNLQFGMARQNIEIGVLMQNRRAGADCDGCDEAINEPANRSALLSAAAVERGCVIVGAWPGRQCYRSRQKPAELPQVKFIPRPGQQLHARRVTGCDVLREQLVNPIADRGSRIPEELYPGRRINQDQEERLDRIASRSPSQPLPRKARASFAGIGSAARVRNAKFTASRLVASP